MQKSELGNGEHPTAPWASPQPQSGETSPRASSAGGVNSNSPASEADNMRATKAPARERAQEATNATKEAVQSAKEQGKVMLEDRKRALADEVHGIERALRRTAKELRREEQKAAGRYAERAAEKPS